MKNRLKNLFQAGAHKTGWAFADSYIGDFPPPSEVLVSDPKGRRADLLAEKWSKCGANGVAYAEECEEVVKGLPDGTVGMLGVDSIPSMTRVIEGTDMDLQWQTFGRSTTNVVLGFSGTLYGEDRKSRESSVSLLKKLSPYELPVSSRHIRSSVLNDRALTYTRREVSRDSAECVYRLSSYEAKPGLKLFFATKQFPLLVFPGEIEPFTEIEKRATEAEYPYTNGSKDYAVAVVSPDQVEIFVVERHKGKKLIRFHTSFGEPISLEDEEETATRPLVRAVVTD